MQQRVALARALAIEPKVLLLDEPLSALDAKVRVQLREEIRRIQLELGITTLYVTHDQEEALSISDRVAVMWNGKIEQIGSPAEMYGSPATPFVAEFIGTMNRLTSTVADDGAIDYEGLRLPVDAARGLPRGERVLCLLRPETVDVAIADGAPAEGGLTGRRRLADLPRRGDARPGRGGRGAKPRRRSLDRPARRRSRSGARRRELPSGEPPAAGPHRGRIAARARPGQSVKMPSTPSAESSRIAFGLVHRVDGRREAELSRLREPAAGHPRVPEPDAPRVGRRGADRDAEPDVLEEAEVGPARFASRSARRENESTTSLAGREAPPCGRRRRGGGRGTGT